MITILQQKSFHLDAHATFSSLPAYLFKSSPLFWILLSIKKHGLKSNIIFIWKIYIITENYSN